MLLRLRFYASLVLSLPFIFLSVLAYQGKKVRQSVPKLPEALEPFGQVGDGDQPLKLLAIGESTIAGVGVKYHKDGITGHLAQYIHEATNKSVHWQVLGKNGYRAREVRELLVPQIPDESLDIIVIGLGGNDTFQLTMPWQWRRDFEALLHAIRAKQPHSTILIANMPPVSDFPAFPFLLQKTLGAWVKTHGWFIEDLPSRFPNVHYNNRVISAETWANYAKGYTAADFFSDGVHPSGLTYQIWAKELVDFAIGKGLFSK